MAISLPPTAPVPDEHLLFDRSARTRWRIGFDRWVGRLLPLLFLVALVPIIDLVYFITVRAAPVLSVGNLTNTNPYANLNGNAMGVALAGTFYVMAIATAVAVLLGLFGGIATAEFLSERSAGWIRMTANMLAGTPSVVVGYFGYFAFVVYFGWGYSMIAGAITLAFFMVPYTFRTVDLAYSSIPRQIREAALGSGARPYQYILKIGTPIAFPQVLTGVFLAMAIGIGETAPIVLTTHTSLLLPSSVYSGVTFLTYLIYTGYSNAPGNNGLNQAFQAAFLIVVIVIALNIAVRIIAARYRKRLEGLFQ
ncbi:MAG TPA: ABC transporter permease subunit [Thermoplasmata archaeon]|nr:ABC transporter permease subunit [Thermoplasmata archaeon]